MSLLLKLGLQLSEPRFINEFYMGLFISGGSAVSSSVPGDTLHILIDRKLILRRQESPEAFVTLTTVVHYRACQIRAESRLLSLHSVPGAQESALLW